MLTKFQNKKIKVSPIRRSGSWLKPGHDGDFAYTGTKIKLVVKPDINTGKLPDPLKDLSTEEKAEIAKVFSKKVEDLNPYKTENNFWESYEVSLDKNIRILNLNDPKDLLDYFVLKTNTNLVAPNLNEKFNKGTYRFVLIDEDEEVIEKRKASDKKKEAYKYFGKLESSEGKLRNFLRLYGKKVPTDANKDWLVGQVDTVIEENIDGLLAIMEDANYDIKLEIQDAVECGALVKRMNNTYELPGGEFIGNLNDAIQFFKSPKNSEQVLVIRSRIETSKVKK